jgi:hypothetical protein
MSERNDHQFEQMRAVTLSREYGSGGGRLRSVWRRGWNGN